MAHDNLFPHLWRLVCAAEERRRLVWSQLTDAAAIRARQAWVRATVAEMIGPFPERCDLAPRVVRQLARDDCGIELVVFDSRPGWPVTGTLYLPRTLDAPAPAVLVPCGHSENGRRYDQYQRVHRALVRAGFVVLAYDPLGQGERHQYLSPDGARLLGGCCHEHCMVGNQLELVGYNLANLRIWDGLRALDYLLSRPEVDPARVGVTGNSGGGTLTTYLLALDDRFAAGAPGCYLTSLVHRIATRMAADSEQQFTPMLARGIDHADLLLCAAPRPVAVLAARRDFFPLAGTRQTVEQVRRMYAHLGAPDAIHLVVADEDHGFTLPLREGAVEWFRRWLQGRDEPYHEPALAIEDEATLQATPTGEVLTSGWGALSVHQLLRRDFPLPLACRRASDPAAALRAVLPGLLGIDPARPRELWPVPTPPVDTRPLPPCAPELTLARVALASECDVVLGGWRLAPRAGADRAVLLLPDRDGGAPLLGLGGLAQTLAAGGAQVLLLEPRGIGEGRGPLPAGFAPGAYEDRYGLETDLTYTSWMLGRPLLGQRVWDALCGVTWLADQGLSVRAVGVGLGGWLALLAAALDARVLTVESRGAPESWQGLYDTPLHNTPAWAYLPRVLTQLDVPDVVAALGARVV